MISLLDIIEEIKVIEQDYQQCQGLVLSEDDLKCHIFRRLYDKISDHNIPTINRGISGSPLHTEVRFYDRQGKLSIIPDITILDPRGMSVKHACSVREDNGHLAYGRLPSKGFEFRGKTIIIEIKFVKSNKGISSSFQDKIRVDLEKIRSLQTRHTNNILGVMVVFNKTNIKPQSLEQLFEEFRSDDLLIYYGTGKVDFG